MTMSIWQDMIFSTTRYIRVSEKNVLPVEVHGLGDDKVSALEDRHIQEILQLLHDILINAVPVKKKEETLKQQTKSGIITGSSVRIGYVFKKRPGNQLCLVPASSVTDLKAREDGEELCSFQVLREKVIVYAHQLYPGSPNRMSQLVKRINDKRQSTGSGVSISSYFQRVPSQSTSTSLAGSSSQSSSGNNSLCRETGKQQEESAPVTPPSEGRRNKIKSILKRVDEKVSKRKHRKHEKRNVSKAPVKQNKASVFEIQTDDSSDEDTKEVNIGKHQEVKKETSQDGNKHGKSRPVSSLASGKSVKDDIKSSSEVVKPDQLASCAYSKALEALPSSVAQKYSNAKSKCEEPGRISSVGYEAAVKAVENKMIDSADDGIEVLDSVDDIEALSETSTNSFVVADGRVSEVSMLGLMIEANDPGKAGAAATLGSDEVKEDVDDDGQAKEVCDAAYTSSDSQADESILPTASFCTKPCNIDDSTSETDILSVSDVKSSKLHDTHKSHTSNLSKELSGKESPKFKRKKSSDCLRERKTAVKADDDKKSDPDSDPEKQCPAKEKSKHSRSKHKRKFPNFSDSDSEDKLHVPVKKVPKTTKTFPSFSDSDSDDMLPVKKGKKSSKPVNKKAPAKYVEPEKTDFTSTCKPVSKKAPAKFVEPEKTDITKRGKWTFGKSLSSGEGSKKQTKLSFFMGKENQETVPDVNEEEESEDLSAGLMEELSQTPRIKQERDSSLKKEITRLSSVKDLNEEHLQHLVRENERHLRHIFEGKTKCRRHDLYKQGARSKRELNYTSQLGQFSDEQVDVVMESLMALFCKRHHKYLDYVMKVLLPEMLIKLHMDVHGTSHSDSETSMAQQQA